MVQTQEENQETTRKNLSDKKVAQFAAYFNNLSLNFLASSHKNEADL